MKSGYLYIPFLFFVLFSCKKNSSDVKEEMIITQVTASVSDGPIYLDIDNNGSFDLCLKTGSLKLPGHKEGRVVKLFVATQSFSFLVFTRLILYF